MCKKVGQHPDVEVAAGAPSPALRRELGQGLLETLRSTRVGGGSLTAMVGYSSQGGPFARAEARYRPAPGFALFGYGQGDRRELAAGAGLSWQW